MSANKDFHITEDDRQWVHECFDWLVKAYGYPNPDFTPILFDEKYFPNSFSKTELNIDITLLLGDLCALHNINPHKISYVIEEDLRDSGNTPYEIQGHPFECDLELVQAEDGYHFNLIFARSLLRHPKRIVFNAVFYFLQIGLSEHDIEWVNNDEHYFLFYLVGVYRGWGVILAQTMIDIGRENELGWQRQWGYVSPMPVPVMTYAMALHSNMREERTPVWVDLLPPTFKSSYEAAIIYIENNPSPVYNKQELTSHSLLTEAEWQYNHKEFDGAIDLFQRSLFLTEDNFQRSFIYNSIGYCRLWKNEYQQSIPWFQKAIEAEPNFGYAYDNLGYAFIMSGDLETGKYYVSLAMKTGKNDAGYSYRNMALYYQKKGDNKKAQEYFQKAFENIALPVDWLEYFYARFLFEQGEKEEAFNYLQMAVDNKEPEALAWMKEINN